jgi:hypothetical protein
VTDRELLDRAAKAAGFEFETKPPLWLHPGIKIDAPFGHRWWNPLLDDGDAMRLAMKLGIGIHFEGRGEDAAAWADDVMMWTDGDVPAATRRVIVNAAAKRDRPAAQGAVAQTSTAAFGAKAVSP